MSRLVIACVLSALACAGCTLIWRPVVADAGADAGLDASADAVVVDAYSAPDAWIPPEICGSPGDEDGDGYANCDDTDCYSDPQCCMTSWPLQSFAPAGSNWRGFDGTTFTFPPSTGSRREFCVPLADGASMRLRLGVPNPGASPRRLGLVLTPAAAPGPTGFVDELAVRLTDGDLVVTAGGATLATPSCSDGRRPRLPPSAGQVTFDVRTAPAVVRGEPGIRIDVRVDGACGSNTLDRVASHLVPVTDLISTADETAGGQSCNGTPGLYLAFEGGPPGTVRPSGTPEDFSATVDRCAAPGSFANVGVTYDTPQLSADTPSLAGGVGSPDLVRISDSEGWLLFDGTERPRVSEPFADPVFAIGRHRGVVTGPFTPGGSPWGGFRQPSALTNSLTTVVVATQSAGTRTRIVRADLAVGLTGTPAFSNLTDPPAGVSHYEPTLLTVGDRTWLLVREDSAGERRLAAGALPVGGGAVVTPTRVGPALDVRALDALVGEGNILYLWLLTGAGDVHLYQGTFPSPTTFPTLTPYAGNPILRSAALSGMIESLTVERYRNPGEPTRLRFLFAVRRDTGDATTYALVARDQFAPPALGLRP